MSSDEREPCIGRLDPDLLDQLLDGELTGQRREEVEDHLEVCPSCAGAWRELRDLREATRCLPREIPPSRDLWPGLVARLPASADDQAPSAGSRGSARQAVVSVRQASGTPRRDLRRSGGGWPLRLRWSQALGAAAALVIAASIVVGLGRQLIQRPASSRQADAARVANATGRASAADPISELAGSGASSRLGFAGYAEVRAGLLAALDGRRDRISPQTLAVILESLNVIDDSIERVAQALDDNPDDRHLVGLLADARRQEIDLLQRATLLPVES